MATTFNPKAKAIRETTCEFVQFVDGQPVKSEIRVQYFSWTTADFKKHEAERAALLADNPEAILWNSEVLAKRLHALPDLVDEDGRPFEITLEFLDLLDVDNVNAIREAVNKDISPKSDATR